MPPRDGGLELIRQLHRTPPKAKIIAMAGGNGHGLYLAGIVDLVAHVML